MERQTLVSALARAQRFSDKSRAAYHLDLAWVESREGQLIVTSTDLDHWASSTVGPQTQEIAPVLVPIAPWLKAARAVKDREITVETCDDGIHFAGITIKRSPVDLDHYPWRPEISDSVVARLDSRGLIEAAAWATPFVSKEESRFQLSGALVELGDALRIVATDGHRLSVGEAECQCDSEDSAILGRPVLQELSKLSPCGEAEIRMGRSHTTIRVGDIELTSRNHDGHFPDWQRVVRPESTLPLQVVLDRQLAIEAADLANRIGVQCTESGHSGGASACLSFAEGIPRLEGSADSVALSREIARVPAAYHHPAPVGINTRYLKEVLAGLPSDDVTLFLKEPAWNATADKWAPGEIQFAPRQPVEGLLRQQAVVMPIRT